jgi:hypothetical protein
MPETDAIRDYDDRSERSKRERPFHPPSDGLILAAIERAVRHDPGGEPDVAWSTLVEHLGFDRGAWATLRLRPHTDALEAEGLLERSNRYGFPHWLLTSKGRKRLDAVRATLGSLPDSPQHRRWQEARTAAGERIGEFRENLRRLLYEGISLLDAGQDEHSDIWFELGNGLGHACALVGSATHCLREWPQPNEAQPDEDDHRRLGRRNIRHWD